jgi:uncharacterized protein
MANHQQATSVCRQHNRFGTVPESPAVATEEKPVVISQEQLDILVCPVCRTPIKPTPDQTALKCQTCRRVYPIRDEIPVMLPEEAQVDAE